MPENVPIESKCHTCPMRQRAEEKPRSLIAMFWRWHTRWCPGWKAYVAELQRKGLETPRV
jgi:hypothetical protein